jgi:hypothetical protein
MLGVVRIRPVTTLGLLLLFALGCGGGGGGSSDEDPTAKSGSGLAASFTPDVTSPGDLTVSMSQSSKSDDTVNVSVDVTGTPDVFGADFRVVYDSTRFKYVGHGIGHLLETGCPEVQYWITPGGSDTLLVAVTCLGGGAGVDVTTTKDLVHLVFRARAEGTSRLDFDTPALFDDHNPPGPIDIDPQSWAGGALIAN